MCTLLRFEGSLPGVDGVVVEKAARRIYDHEPTLEIDFLHDFGDIWDQSFPMSASNDESGLAFTRVESDDFANNIAFGRTALETHQMVFVVIALRKVLERLFGQEEKPSPPALDRLAVTNTFDRKQPFALVKTHPVDVVELCRFSIVANAEPNAVGEPLGKIGDDIHEHITMDTVRLSRLANDQPARVSVVGGRHGLYSRISRTNRL